MHTYPKAAFDAGVSRPTVEPRDDGLMTQLDELHATIAHAHDTLTELQERLAPITKALPPQQEGVKDSLGLIGNSQLGERVTNIRHAAAELIERINALKYGIDL